MPRGRPLKALEVSRGAREELESPVRSRSLPAGLVRLDIHLVADKPVDKIPPAFDRRCIRAGPLLFTCSRCIGRRVP